MLDAVPRYLRRLSSQPRSTTYRAWAVVIGIGVFFGLGPPLLGLAGRSVARHLPVLLPRAVEIPLGLLLMLSGLALLLWSAATFWRVGHGTPAPVAAPQRLVVVGPFRHCRNPIELGALCFYFGVGCVFLSFIAGVTMFAIGLILGSTYHRLFEEKELRLRFGADYERYRQRTPFLIPRPRRSHEPDQPEQTPP